MGVPYFRYLLTFMLTFVVGIAVFAGLHALFLSEGEIAHLRDSVDEVEKGQFPRNWNAEPLAVEYNCSLMGVDSLDALFILTNNGSEPIYFTIDNRYGKSLVHLSDASGKLNQDARADIYRRELLPGETVGLAVPVPLDGAPFDLSLRYQIGERLRSDSVFVSVPSQVKSYTCGATVTSN
jgi:hypothetical protein